MSANGDAERPLQAEGPSTQSQSFCVGCEEECSHPVEETPKTNMREATMNLVCGGLGTGMLSLPWTMAGAGLIPGVLILFGIVAVNIWTIVILVAAAERHQVFDLGGLLRLLPGRLGPASQALTNGAIWFTLILTLIGYVDSIYTSAVPLVEKMHGEGSWLLEGRLPLCGIASIVVLPLCFLDQKYLSFTSVLGVLANVNLLALVFFLFAQRSADGSLGEKTCLLGYGKGSVTMVSSATNSIIIQMCILPMYEAFENRTPERFGRVLVWSFGSLAVLLSVFSAFAYLVVGHTVSGNVLEDLPRGTWGNLTQAGMIIVIFAVYPIFLMPMIAPLRTLPLKLFCRDLEARSLVSNQEKTELIERAARRRRWLVNGTTGVVVLVSFLLSLWLADLGMINALNGSIE
eukprot:TRINITY_DN13240_c0_g1_i2.p1 TRINITY_DN13240_c0_g1~~TRINITY_DN13240_c0_g1_i2.p1  ORF type:complete len:403 (+),score=74.22 TRINITY_DN13240_c0_g1_i2:64-1272(+)